MMLNLLQECSRLIEDLEPVRQYGRVSDISEMIIQSVGPAARLGEICEIHGGGKVISAEVVGLKEHLVQLMPFSEIYEVNVGDAVYATGASLHIPVGEALLGSVIDTVGQEPSLFSSGGRENASVFMSPPDPLARPPIREQLVTGIRSIDAFLPTGKGQRMGIFSGSGVGKSTLLGMIANRARSDVNVIALIGERGREVREFIEQNLGEEGMKRSVLVVATSDKPPLARFRAAFAALTIAEYFRDEGKDVLLLFDSVTRFARAMREIALVRGELPAFRGFPSSVDALLPRLLERCGTSPRGSITGFFSTLVEGDDLDEPVSDMMRGILDGHIILSRKLARRNHYPAIDILSSVSRLAPFVSTKKMQDHSAKLRKSIALYEDSEDLIQSGVYMPGSNAELDKACELMKKINPFLQQEIHEFSDRETTIEQLELLGGEVYES